MQPREKILAGLLATVIAVWFLGPLCKSWFVDPLKERNTEISNLERNVTGLELKQAQLLEAMRVHQEWLDGSLPPETYAAQREYRNWLYAMAQLAGWENIDFGPPGQNNRYASFTPVSTTLKGEATLDAIDHFLSLMESARLVHRVSDLHIECPDSDGNPVMNVSITLEGVAMADAARRTRLFPTTLLTEDCSRRDDVVRVDSTAGFPEAAPFRIRIQNELLDVVAIEDGDWQVERGVAATFSDSHEAEDVVELLPVRESVPDAADLALLVDRIFVQPRERSMGRKQFAELPAAVRGREFSSRLEVENWDPEDGTPRFELLGGAPDGLEFSPASGRLDWEPADDAELTTYELQVAAYGADPDKPVLEETLTLEVRRPNHAPELSQPDRIDAWLGRELTLEPEVEDADLPGDELSFSLSGDVPPDLNLDRRTGRIRWTPSITEDLGELELELTVTDSGVPQESDRVRLVFDLRDDSARYTYLVGTIIQGEDREAWLNDRSEPDASQRMTRLKEGESFQVADVAGTVEAIRLGAIEIRSDGALYQLSKGQNLRDWQRIEGAASDQTPSAAGALGAVDAP